MTWLFHPTGGPGDGLFPVTHRVDATNRTGATLLLGEAVIFDTLLGTDVDDLTPGSTDATDGDNTSQWNNVVAPTQDSTLGIDAFTIIGFNGGRLGTAGIPADNALADIIYFGFGKALVQDDTDSVAIGDFLGLETDGSFRADHASDDLLVAQAREVMTTPTAPTLADIFLAGTLLGTFVNTVFT